MPVPRFVRRLVVAAALGGAVTVALALSANLPATLDALGRFRWSLGPVVVGATLVNYALRFLKWDFYLRRLAVPLPRRQSLLVFLAGFTMSITPGKVGELLKAFLVRDLVGTELSRTASVVMAERLTDVAGLVILSALGATALPHGGVLLGTIAVLPALPAPPPPTPPRPPPGRGPGPPPRAAPALHGVGTNPAGPPGPRLGRRPLGRLLVLRVPRL